MRLSNPWPKGFKISSGYGYRNDPFNGSRRKHRGLDITGTFDVTSAGDGVFHSKGYNASGGGYWAKVDHGSGIYSVYYHGKHEAKPNKGDRVKAGDFIFISGSTGRSLRPHLHFEVRKNSPAWGFDVDPGPYLSGTGAGPGAGVLAVNGRLDKATVRRWQELLKAGGFEPGLVDGRMGANTVKAIQRSVGVKPDGVMGPVTRKAVQKRVDVREDGVWGRITVSAIQRRLNGGKW